MKSNSITGKSDGNGRGQPQQQRKRRVHAHAPVNCLLPCIERGDLQRPKLHEAALTLLIRLQMQISLGLIPGTTTQKLRRRKLNNSFGSSVLGQTSPQNIKRRRGGIDPVGMEFHSTVQVGSKHTSRKVKIKLTDRGRGEQVSLVVVLC